jgi:predicted unusual protein kinase regulating ubiquinone biosynthesis (AarF/ABC1/UbiB family)
VCHSVSRCDHYLSNFNSLLPKTQIGQSLSIRTDLLSPAYVRGLKTLQDQVPPFSTVEAREIIENELGSPIDSIFVNFPNEPIAAASLGQVYKATIQSTSGDPKEVAVKVQRPNIMNQIALDMHLIREVAPVLKRTFNLNTDFVGIVDTWGLGFVDELDYIEEAVNAKSFMGAIASTPLAGVVFSPPVMDEWTTRRVLTTEWVVGERLDRSAKSDVSILCSIAMNTYLTMMLETGTLHCDPHPGTKYLNSHINYFSNKITSFDQRLIHCQSGNLLRTTDGRLCILDWGMVCWNKYLAACGFVYTILLL